jgi:hypothetical protein
MVDDIVVGGGRRFWGIVSHVLRHRRRASRKTEEIAGVVLSGCGCLERV